jgi:hypothetical protein
MVVTIILLVSFGFWFKFMCDSIEEGSLAGFVFFLFLMFLFGTAIVRGC